MASQPPMFNLFGPGDAQMFTEAAPVMPGLGGEIFAPSQLPTMPTVGDYVTQRDPAPQPKVIEKLKPGSTLHHSVRAKLDAMLKFSRDEMRKHYARWNVSEQKLQAFINCYDYAELSESLKPGQDFVPPENLRVVVPYTYATAHAACTYIASVLLGRKPVFPLSGTRGTNAESARHMETALQHHLDMSLGQEQLWQQIWDSFNYSFSVVRVGWEQRMGSVIRLQGGQRIESKELKFAGNTLHTVDPYRCYPDPRVPVHRCNTDGDFYFTQLKESELTLNQWERDGKLMWVEEGLKSDKQVGHIEGRGDESQRNSRINFSQPKLNPTKVTAFRSPFEGTVRLVPKDWGLGESLDSELWHFVWFEGGQIMKAEKLSMLHDMHPIVAAEPASFGHDFLSLSQTDMISVFQDIISWLVTSRMENVRAAVNNSFIYDPQRVEVNDITAGPIGRMIRLKQAYTGSDVDHAIKQLMINDVTGGHLQDIQVMRLLADTTTGVNDNMRGIQTQGGRRSATEARMSMQAGAGRLSQQAIRISSQSYWRLASQMIMNIQQYMPDEMWVEQTGDTGSQSLKLTPDMLIGEFNYQISDGTLPLDKGALLEQWKEILFGVAQDPELRQKYSLGEIFRFTAQLGGAKNIDSFERPPAAPSILPPGQEPSADQVPIGVGNPAMPATPFV